jgi:anthranilate synthase component 2
VILIIDNYDSFTYNLVQYIGELGVKEGVVQEIKVYRNDKIDLEGVRKLNPGRIIISPGPGGPSDAGISNDLIAEFSGKIPILGVCLGHQCIGHVFGAKIVRAEKLMHGKTSLIYHDGREIYEGIENPFVATRYHSLIIKRSSIPKCLHITAWTQDGEIMGIRHRLYDVEGVQFHPESILTKVGKRILKNFILKGRKCGTL